MKYCTPDIMRKMDEYISNHKDEIIADLFELVRIPSINGEPAEGAPFGAECAKMTDVTADMFEKAGFDTVVKKDLGYSLSYYGKGDKSIGLFSHTDVVTVDDQWQVCKPFEPIIKDGYIFGRGCNDDKSGVIQTLYAAKMIRDLELELNSRIVMYNGANEETGMQDIKSFVDNETMPDASLVPDGMYPCVYGERSMLKFDIISKKPFNTIRKFHGGESFNILLGKLEAEIVHTDELYAQLTELCKDNDRIDLSSDGTIISVIGTGVAKHIMEAEDGLNAAWVVSDVLSRCNAVDADDRKIMKFIASLLADANGTGFGLDHTDPDFGRLVCGNGIVRLTDDGRLKLTFDGRIGLSFGLEEVEKTVIETCGKDWEYICLRKSMGYLLDENDPKKIAIENVYASISGIEGKKGIKIAAGTYARELKNALPLGTVAYYLAENREMPDGHGGVHQPDEMMHIGGFLEAIKILACCILEIDKVI